MSFYVAKLSPKVCFPSASGFYLYGMRRGSFEVTSAVVPSNLFPLAFISGSFDRLGYTLNPNFSYPEVTFETTGFSSWTTSAVSGSTINQTSAYLEVICTKDFNTEAENPLTGGGTNFPKVFPPYSTTGNMFMYLEGELSGSPLLIFPTSGDIFSGNYLKTSGNYVEFGELAATSPPQNLVAYSSGNLIGITKFSLVIEADISEAGSGGYSSFRLLLRTSEFDSEWEMFSLPQFQLIGVLSGALKFTKFFQKPIEEVNYLTIDDYWSI